MELKTCSILLLIITVGYTEARCKCELLLKHYEELGCKPVYANDTDCCPRHYDCDAIIRQSVPSANTTPLPKACFFRGRYYGDGQRIEDNSVNTFCRANCHCQGTNIVCAIVDCKEFFGDKLEKDCFRQYQHYQCCSTGKVCPPFDKLAVCKNGEKVYYEGQKFNPEEEPCLSCICQKGFNGKLEAPFCISKNCNFEPKLHELKNHCTPVYHGTKRCCASHWTCPTQESENIGKPADEKADKTKVCLYGKRMLNIGEKFDLQNNINCTCSVPPLVTCIKRSTT